MMMLPPPSILQEHEARIGALKRLVGKLVLRTSSAIWSRCFLS